MWVKTCKGIMIKAKWYNSQHPSTLVQHKAVQKQIKPRKNLLFKKTGYTCHYGEWFFLLYSDRPLAWFHYLPGCPGSDRWQYTLAQVIQVENGTETSTHYYFKQWGSYIYEYSCPNSNTLLKPKGISKWVDLYSYIHLYQLYVKLSVV